MKKIAYFLIYLLFVSFSILSANELQDSTKVYYFKPVIVTATRTKILLEKSPVYSHIITREAIFNSNFKTIADVLSFSGGIFIKDYGPASGLKTISIRGTSAENNLILINGIRVNNFQNGLVDLSLLNPDIIDKIEIVHGGNTALYGTDAVGSVINILTLNPEEKMKAGLVITKSSFDYNKLALSLSNKFKNLGTRFSFIREYGKDNYKYRLPNSNKIEQRKNTDFSRNNFYLSNYMEIDKLAIKTYATYTHFDRNLPGNLSFPSTTSSQLDRNIYLQLLARYQYLDNLYFELNNGWNFSFQKYNEPLYDISSFSKNNQFLINPQTIYKINDKNSLIMGIEYVSGILKGTDYKTSIDRLQKSVYLTGIFMFNIDYGYLNTLSVYPSLRYEKFNNIGSEFSPKLGLNLGIVDGLNFKTSYGKNYRIPTLNELFYIDEWGSKGNPNLRPEYSNSVDLGLSYSFYFLGNVNLEYSLFYINTKDKIVWKEIEPWIYSPQNLEKVSSKGSLIDVNYHIANYKFSMNYTYTNSKKVSKLDDADLTYNKQLIYTPRYMWNLNLSANYGFLTVSLNHLIVSKRYIDDQNIYALAEYQLTNANIGISYNSTYGNLFIKFGVNNIFNKSFQVIKDYPMPLRNYTLSIGLDY